MRNNSDDCYFVIITELLKLQDPFNSPWTGQVLLSGAK